MEFSPSRSWLYRRGARAVTFCRIIRVVWIVLLGLGASALVAQGPIIQYGQKGKVDKGPRAIGLVQIPEKGKARLTPIAIMMDGKFFDAASYKAAPVPMALDFGVVYEGFRSGVSQGIFTITQPGQLGSIWIAEGTWLPAGLRAEADAKTKKYSPPVIEDTEGPPVLHRRVEKSDSDNSGKNQDKGKAKDAEAKEAKKDTDKDKDPDKAASGKDNTKTSSAKTSPPVSDEPIQDPNRPRLRRGAPESVARREVYAKFEPLVTTPASSPANPAKGGDKADPVASAPVTVFPAISDEGGPDPRPYIYEVKPAEEAMYRGKMLDLAATQFRSQPVPAKTAAAPKKSFSTKTAGKASPKSTKPEFDDVSLHFFDLSNSNEPVLVLSAKASLPDSSGKEVVGERKEITLIARTNLEGELKKLFFSQTDSHHLDQTPRMELIDAVDADGDGRGELLFRRVFDSGSTYAIYRVAADHLWPLFEETP
jgi:hypothetical protein